MKMYSEQTNVSPEDRSVDEAQALDAMIETAKRELEKARWAYQELYLTTSNRAELNAREEPLRETIQERTQALAVLEAKRWKMEKPRAKTEKEKETEILERPS